VVVFVLGLLFILGGLALVVLPGPLTIPPILVGVYLWSLEFGWAQRLRSRAEQSARDAWEAATAHPARASLITGAGLVLAAVAVWAVLHFDLVRRVKDALG
jgi:drug/metabolite transporter (DMT)-like permease